MVSIPEILATVPSLLLSGMPCSRAGAGTVPVLHPHGPGPSRYSNREILQLGTGFSATCSFRPVGRNRGWAHPSRSVLPGDPSKDYGL